MAWLSVLVFVVAFMFIYALQSALAGTRLRVSRRVALLSGRTVKRQAHGDHPKRHPRGTSWMSRLDTVLRRAELEVTANEFVLRWALLTLAGAALIGLAVGLGACLVAVAVSGLGTSFYLRTLSQRRTKRFNDGLHEMLTIVSNSLRAGHSFVQALHVVAQEMEGPIREELQRIEAELQIGVPMEETLERANERIGSGDFDLIVTAISIQRQVGGNLAEVLDKIADTIRERVRLQHEVKALTSQGRLSANIFMVLPAGLAVILYLINPDYISTLFNTAIGLVLLAVAAVSQFIGYIFIRRIVRVEL